MRAKWIAAMVRCLVERRRWTGRVIDCWIRSFRFDRNQQRFLIHSLDVVTCHVGCPRVGYWLFEVSLSS